MPTDVSKRHIHPRIIPYGDAPHHLQSFMSTLFHVDMPKLCTRVYHTVHFSALTHKRCAYVHPYACSTVLTPLGPVLHLCCTSVCHTERYPDFTQGACVIQSCIHSPRTNHIQVPYRCWPYTCTSRAYTTELPATSYDPMREQTQLNCPGPPTLFHFHTITRTQVTTIDELRR